MLPLEVLKVVFGALSRDDLDSLQLVSIPFNAVIARDFASSPFRLVHRLDVVARDSAFEFVFRDNDPNESEKDETGVRVNSDDFAKRMRLCRIGRLRLDRDLVADRSLINMLSPFRDAWQLGQVWFWCGWTEESLFTEALNEIFTCKFMMFFMRPSHNVSISIMQLAGVRTCHGLSIMRPPVPIAPVELVEWLRTESSSRQPKRLIVGPWNLALTENVSVLLDLLVQDFIEGVKPASFSVYLKLPVTCRHPFGARANDVTDEVLEIREDLGCLAVDRKPMRGMSELEKR